LDLPSAFVADVTLDQAEMHEQGEQLENTITATLEACLIEIAF